MPDPSPPQTTLPARDTSLNLHARMLLAMAKVGYVPKLGTGPEQQGSYAFARVEHIKDAVRSAFIEVGVMVHVSMEGRDIQVITGEDRSGRTRSSILATVWGMMTFVNVDDPTDRHEVAILGQGIDNSDKAISKATTSADKFGLLNALQIPTGEDPDATGESLPERRAGSPQARPRATRAPEPGPDDGMGPPPPTAAPTAAGGRCPKHDRPWKDGKYCTAKDPSTPTGWCNLKPSKDWQAANER